MSCNVGNGGRTDGSGVGEIIWGLQGLDTGDADGSFANVSLLLDSAKEIEKHISSLEGRLERAPIKVHPTLHEARTKLFQ